MKQKTEIMKIYQTKNKNKTLGGGRDDDTQPTKELKI
jgi:hypothetical protein